MKIKNILNRNSILLLIAFLMLWLNFSGHILSTLPLKKFHDGEFPSERYVISRLVYNLEHGTKAQGGFMLNYAQTDTLYKSVEREDYAAFKVAIQSGSPAATKIHRYDSHAGIQDDLIFPLWQGLEKLKAKILSGAREGSRWQKRLQTLDWYYYTLISQTLIALINALVLTLFIAWVARQFTTAHGWLVLGLLLLAAPVLTFFGRSMWWMMWSWFLPMIITLWGLMLCKGQPPKAIINILMGAAIGGAITLKVLMGYEFTSVVMVAALTPVVFFAIYQSWSFAQWFRVSAILGLFCLVGFASAFALHWNALEADGIDASALFQSRFEVRAHGGETVDKNYKGYVYESTQAPFLGVLLSYLVSPKELAIPQLLLMFPFLGWLLKYLKTTRSETPNNERRLWDAFIATIGVSFVGGASMLFIFKGHAYIHGFDVAIWMIPLNLFLFTFYALKIVPLGKK